MLGQIVRVGVRMSAGVAVGVIPGTLYAGLIGMVNFVVDGPWDQIPAFPVGGVLVGSLFGLLGGVAWALSGAAAPDSGPPPAGGRVPVMAESQRRNRSPQAPLWAPARRSDSGQVGRRSRRPRFPCHNRGNFSARGN
jgi:hypothetical protein